MTQESVFANTYAVISGGSSGIGFAIAKQFVKKGGSVVLLARQVEKLKHCQQELQTLCKLDSQFVEFCSVDLCDFEILQTTLHPVLEKHGTPEYVIHSAGVVYPAVFEKTSIDRFRWMMDTNYFAAVNLFQIMVPLMKARKSGHLVAMGSAASFLAIWGYSAYNGSKFAIRGLCDTLRSELKPYNVKVSIVFPPDTDTPQLAYENQFKPKITQEIAGTIQPLSADFVAEKIIEGVIKNKYMIMPDAGTKIVFRLVNFLGGGTYKLLDYLTSKAIKKHGLDS
jgi:3-dehydrosphinganine reductase